MHSSFILLSLVSWAVQDRWLKLRFIWLLFIFVTSPLSSQFSFTPSPPLIIQVPGVYLSPSVAYLRFFFSLTLFLIAPFSSYSCLCEYLCLTAGFWKWGWCLNFSQTKKQRNNGFKLHEQLDFYDFIPSLSSLSHLFRVSPIYFHSAGIAFNANISHHVHLSVICHDIMTKLGRCRVRSEISAERLLYITMVEMDKIIVCK